MDDELKKKIRRAMRRGTIAEDLTPEERTRFAELKARVEMFNRAIPELRIKLPEGSMSIEPLLSVDLKICIDYYGKCAGLRFEKDSGNKIAKLLISFMEQHPVEWKVCLWKNDVIAEIVLGQLECFNEKPDQLASNWLKSYWRREKKLKKRIELDVSPKRTAASSAVHEVDFLMLIDQLPGMFDRPGFRNYADFVHWLNRNWYQSAKKKEGQALLEELFKRFRKQRPKWSLPVEDLADICTTYKRLVRSYYPDAVPPSAAVLAWVARKHGVSPRLVTKIRAEMNREQQSFDTPKKARS